MNSSAYMPEGLRLNTEENKSMTQNIATLQTAKAQGIILEGIAVSCDSEHNLIVDIAGKRGIIPREECASGIASGKTRDIAILSRVGKPVCFVVIEATEEKIILSRRIAQDFAQKTMLNELKSGDIINALITHLEPFGAFVDIGCGVVSFIGIENISVSRITHPSERFHCGQLIHAVVLYTDNQTGRIHLTHRELLGTWEQNANKFNSGETVRGIVRSIEPYGIFIELAPNLSGLSERKNNLNEGDAVSVYIKSIIPERMKIKLNVIDKLEKMPSKLNYFITEGHIDKWIYSPECCETKYIATSFSQD